MKTRITHKKLLPITILLIFSLSLTGCRSYGHNPHRQLGVDGFYFDTICTLVAVDAQNTDELQEALDQLAVYESYFSNTLPDSDISKINAAPVGTPVKVHPETLELLRIAKNYGVESDGAFDMTIGALSAIWNFKEFDGTLPSDESVQSALATVDYSSVELDEKNCTVTRTLEGSVIDLGGIAKGYAADKLAEYLRARGICEHGFISLGGNIVTLNEDDTWPTVVGIEKPFGEDGEAICRLHAVNKSVVTSGTYQRYFEYDGVIYHHLLDTTTGYPIQNGLTSVTIVNDSSVDGDALSTYCFALGLEDGLAYVNALPNTEAIFVTDTGEVYYTDGMNQYLEND